MNRKQKTCLLVGITVIVVMGLYPPWVLESKEIWARKPKYTLEPGPYSWIGSPPTRPATYKEVIDWDKSIWIEAEGKYGFIAHKQELVKPAATARFIDLYRLGLQYFVVAVVTAGLIVILKDRKGSK